MDAALNRAVLGQARQRDACHMARRAAVAQEPADRAAADIFVRLRERQTTASPQLVGPERHLNQEPAATAALKPAEHPQASAQMERQKARWYPGPQKDEQLSVAPLQERFQELAEARDATPGAPQGVRLSADRAQAQNARGRPAAAAGLGAAVGCADGAAGASVAGLAAIGRGSCSRTRAGFGFGADFAASAAASCSASC